MIEKMVPIEEYGGSDDASMAANNSSAFNCRDITLRPGVFSNHSWGRAIDINPLTNPYVKGDKVFPPEGREYLDRTRAFPGSILAGSFAVNLFEKKGWTWEARGPTARTTSILRTGQTAPLVVTLVMSQAFSCSGPATVRPSVDDLIVCLPHSPGFDATV